MIDYGEFTPITVRSDTTPIERFSPEVWALAERVWAEMLTVKHPADEFQKLRDIEEIAEAIQTGPYAPPKPPYPPTLAKPNTPLQ